MKEFFQKKAVIIVESIVIALAGAGLIIAGTTVEQVQQIPALAAGVLASIEALITMIQGLTQHSGNSNDQ